MSRGLLGILKLGLFILLLPLLIAVIVAFHKELDVFKQAQDIFIWGVMAYTVLHLFIFTPQALYRFWQGVFMEICAFAGTVANIIVLAIPIVMTVMLLTYYMSTVIFRQPWAVSWVIFLVGFALAFHVILSAQELYEADDTQLKGHYLLTLSLVFIVNILITAGLLDLIFKNFSAVSFLREAVHYAEKLYVGVFRTAGIR